MKFTQIFFTMSVVWIRVCCHPVSCEGHCGYCSLFCIYIVLMTSNEHSKFFFQASGWYNKTKCARKMCFVLWHLTAIPKSSSYCPCQDWSTKLFSEIEKSSIFNPSLTLKNGYDSLHSKEASLYVHIISKIRIQFETS